MPDLHLSLNLKQSNVGGGAGATPFIIIIAVRKALSAYYDMLSWYFLTGHRINENSGPKYSLKIFISSFPVFGKAPLLFSI